MTTFSKILYKALPFLSPDKNMLNRAIWQYHLHEGIANVIADNPEAYITSGYEGNADVYSIINRICNMSKQAQLVLVQKKGGKKQQVDEHELCRFLEMVNPHTSTDYFISQAIVLYLTLGNHFTYHPRITIGPNAGKVVELHCMPATEVEIIEGNWMDQVKGYRIQGNQTTIPVEDVYHLKTVNPSWNRDKSMFGLSPLKAAARVVSKQNQAELTELKQFENQGAPFALFRKSVSDGGPKINADRMTDAQVNNLEGQLERSRRDKNKGKPLIFKDEYGILQFGSTTADLNIIESSRDGRRILCNIYGFPVDLMNDPAGSTYNNKSTARKSAWTDCIQPLLFDITSMLNGSIISGTQYEKEGYAFEFDFSQVEELQEGIDVMVGWMRKARWTPNEIRIATGKERYEHPIMDEPSFEMGDVPLSEMGITLDAEKSFEDYLQKKP